MIEICKGDLFFVCDIIVIVVMEKINVGCGFYIDFVLIGDDCGRLGKVVCKNLICFKDFILIKIV